MSSRWGLLATLCAGAAWAGPAIELSIQETGGGDLEVQRALAEQLTQSGWRVVPPAKDAVRCRLTGTVSFSTLGKQTYARYHFEATTETGKPLATADGQVGPARPRDARVQAVNAIRSALTAGLTAHVMPDEVAIDGVDADAQVQALRTALSSLRGVSATDAGHLSNGTLTLELTSRLSAAEVARAFPEIRVEGKGLAVDYAGVDLVTAALR